MQAPNVAAATIDRSSGSRTVVAAVPARLAPSSADVQELRNCKKPITT